MAQSVLIGSLLFGLVLIAIVAYVARHEWQNYSPSGNGFGEQDSGPSLLARAAHSPAVWTATFVVAVIAVGVATVVLVGETSTPGWLKQSAGAFLAASAGIVLTLYLFYGTFVSARGRGLKNSQAAALGSWFVGMLFIAVLVVKLFGVF